VGKASLPPLYLVSDADRVGDHAWLDVLRRAFDGGLRWVLLREPDWSGARIGRLAEQVVDVAPPDCLVSLSWRPGSAAAERLHLLEALDLEGLHLGACEPNQAARMRERVGAGKLLGYSAHSAQEIQEALGAGADYASLSPVFAPLSKRSAGLALGHEGLRAACAAAAGPVYALGGITAERVRDVRAAGAAGIAVIGAITDADDPSAAVRGLLAAWRGPSSAPVSQRRDCCACEEAEEVRSGEVGHSEGGREPS
jgi:thiamine-phosphate pyrophosphorylase